MNKIYIAGFDVFYLDAKKRGKKMKEICNKYGFQGLFPLDNEITKNDKKELAQKIFEGNINYIKECDFIVANLNNFRGFEPDSGTCFECGVGYALGKKLYGYIDDISYLKNKYIKNINNCIFTDLDKNNMIIENFDLPLNLMLSIPITIIQGNFEDVIERLHLEKRTNLFYNFLCGDTEKKTDLIYDWSLKNN